MKWIKWWKDKTFMSVLGIALGTIGVSFLLAYFITWGWVPAIAVALAGGFAIRKVVVRRLDEIADNL